MSLNKKHELMQIAKTVSRELRINSTEAEKIFWAAARNRKILNKKFFRQYPIFYDLTGSESFFIADFFCFEEKLIIEIDGKIHEYQLKKDTARTDILNSLGIKVIRFKNEMIKRNLAGVLEIVKENLTRPKLS
jgi:very-short-patch-repair endonuclease